MSDPDDLRQSARDDEYHEYLDALEFEEQEHRYYYPELYPQGDDDPDNEFPSYEEELQYPHFGPDQ